MVAIVDAIVLYVERVEGGGGEGIVEFFVVSSTQ